MHIYLVGGAVRDQLLGLPVRERDWVVVGATPEDLQALGYRPVGRDFPVFLHPDTHEEYALARTERKTAAGHQGFRFDAHPDVTLEADLARRDLTINAMAQADDGTLIDPHGGQQDLQARWLRHVSPAFVEDPLRVLRVARFAARLQPLGFRVAPETRQLMARIAASGELEALSPERVWKEFRRALTEQAPRAFLEVLTEASALPVVLPLLAELRPNVCAQAPHAAFRSLDSPAAAQLPAEARAQARFLALVAGAAADCQRAPTLDQGLDNREAGAHAREFVEGLRVPAEWQLLAAGLARFWSVLGWPQGLDAVTLHEAIARLDLVRRPQRIEPLAQALDALLWALDVPASHRSRCRDLLQRVPKALDVSVADLVAAGTPGPEIGAALAARRRAALASLLAED